jgi:hypothetical protein
MSEIIPKAAESKDNACIVSSRPPFLQWINATLYNSSSSRICADEVKLASLAMNHLYDSGFSMPAMQTVSALYSYFKILRDNGDASAARSTLDKFGAENEAAVTTRRLNENVRPSVWNGCGLRSG